MKVFVQFLYEQDYINIAKLGKSYLISLDDKPFKVGDAVAIVNYVQHPFSIKEMICKRVAFIETFRKNPQYPLVHFLSLSEFENPEDGELGKGIALKIIEDLGYGLISTCLQTL